MPLLVFPAGWSCSVCFYLWFSTPQADIHFVTSVFTFFSAKQLSLLSFMVAKGTTDVSCMINVQRFITDWGCLLIVDFTFLQDRNNVSINVQAAQFIVRLGKQSSKFNTFTVYKIAAYLHWCKSKRPINQV